MGDCQSLEVVGRGSMIRVFIDKYSARFSGLIMHVVSESVSACHRDTVRDSAAWNGHGMRKGILQLPNPARDPCHPFTRDTEGGWSGHRTLAQQRFNGAPTSVTLPRHWADVYRKLIRELRSSVNRAWQCFAWCFHPAVGYSFRANILIDLGIVLISRFSYIIIWLCG